MQRIKIYYQGFIFLLLLIRSGICSVSVVSSWEPKFINVSIFNDPSFPSEEIPTNSDTQCALIGSKLKWPNVMHFDTGICHLAYVDLFRCQNAVIQDSSAVEGKWLYRGMYDNCTYAYKVCSNESNVLYSIYSLCSMYQFVKILIADNNIFLL